MTGLSFFERHLQFWISQDVPRAGLESLAIQAHQVDPAHLRAHRTAQYLAHPLGDHASSPVVAFRGGATDGCGQRSQLLPREQWRCTMGVRVAPVVHTLGALSVIALGDLANPVARISRTLGDIFGQLAPSQQPQNLPPRLFIRLFGRPVASFELVDAQIRSEMNSSCHAPILQVPSKRRYHSVCETHEATQTADPSPPPHSAASSAAHGYTCSA